MKKIFSSLVAAAMLAFILLPVAKVSAETLQIITANLPDATVGQSYSTQIQGSGGVGPYTWTTISTTYTSACCVLGLNGNSQPLPAPYITFNTQSETKIIGSPGTYSWNLQIADSTGATANKTVYLKINPAATPTLIVSDPAVSFNYTKGGTVPTSYSAHISNNSNTQTINYNISVPNQPAWLNTGYNTATLPLGPLQTAGIGVSVDPTNLSVGTYNTTINLSGNFSNSPASIAVTLKVSTLGEPLQIITAFLPDATMGQSYTTVIQGSGGVGPYTWTTISTNYPSGCCVLGLSGNSQPLSAPYITFNTQSSQTVLDNIPAGNYYWNLQIKDSVGNTATRNVYLKINPAASSTTPVADSYTITTTKLPDATVGKTYATGIDYTSNNNFSLNSNFNSLPPGLRTGVGSDILNNYGMTPSISGGKGTVYINGTPTTAGTYTINLQITNPNWSGLGMSGASKQFTIQVNPATVDNIIPVPTTITPVPTPVVSTPGINLPDGTVLKLPGSATVYLVSGGQLKPFTSSQDFLGQGYKWSDVQQVSPSQVQAAPITTTVPPSTPSGFYPYPSGSIVNDDGTIFFINGSTKIPFTNYDAFVGLGYSLRNVIVGDLTNYSLSSNYAITTANAAHPWGSWLIYKGTVYYSTQNGMIGVPSGQVLMSNGGSWGLLVKANSYDVAALNANSNLPVLTVNDSRVYSAGVK